MARAVAYVLGNFAIHAARMGRKVASKGTVDRFCSAVQQGVPLTAPARTWVLRVGSRRAAG